MHIMATAPSSKFGGVRRAVGPVERDESGPESARRRRPDEPVAIDSLARVTGVFEVWSGQRLGRLHLRAGRLFQAECGELRGEAAASEVLSWLNVRVRRIEQAPVEECSVHSTPFTVLLRLTELSASIATADEHFGQVEFGSGPLPLSVGVSPSPARPLSGPREEEGGGLDSFVGPLTGAGEAGAGLALSAVMPPDRERIGRSLAATVPLPAPPTVRLSIDGRGERRAATEALAPGAVDGRCLRVLRLSQLIGVSLQSGAPRGCVLQGQGGRLQVAPSAGGGVAAEISGRWVAELRARQA